VTVVHREPVLDEWIDYNGHLSEPYYVLVLGHATDAVMDAVGIDEAFRAAEDASLFTVEAHVRYLDQIPPEAHLTVRSSVIGVTGKLLWVWHEMWCEGRLRATEEVLMVHVDTAGENLLATVQDFGREFDPLSLPIPDLSASLDERKVGGLGIHLMRSLMDEVKYRRVDGKNLLSMRKRIR
jgi:acyl-CoA thioester hydrolase